MRHIPNTLTLCNLLLGLVALGMAVQGHALTVWYLILGASLCDLADGWMARRINVPSSIGKDLDSLADLVTFGAAPALTLAFYLKELSSQLSDFPWLSEINISSGGTVSLPYLWGLWPALGSALRLARFNNDPRQSEWFRGLPTPASGLFLLAFILWLKEVVLPVEWILAALAVVALALPILMLSAWPMLSLKVALKPPVWILVGIILVGSGLFSAWLINFGACIPIMVMYLTVSLLVKKHFSHEVHR
ncbi:MAG: CDP-alcohol phosphatidyltransferase family protein [Flavobacteriales bacterium]|nr:CDP-alcohol phosphatidyltransferase family protein [Flavobacteriales bacterium]MCX7767607.1 CDP-alcohol phosphatidyltransferase family protein [Flavobacteriales bacterium]MDW8409551.1 CDP-alcohol phosphatidyltransferase family protein [Flavobacteriales bacterium]